MGIKAVIIDDGVYSDSFIDERFINEDFIQTPNISMRLQVMEDNTIVEDNSEAYLSHGTLCASVIGDLSPNSEFISIKVLDEQGQGYSAQLVCALEWCLENEIKLIHMSLGTTNYHDFSKVGTIINKLTQRDVIIVAAYSNMNIPSVPAHLPKVFGVRSDKDESLKNGEYFFDNSHNLREENSMVAHYDKTGKINVGVSNSFAAPVITSHILRLLNTNPNMKFKDILECLKENQSNKKNKTQFCDYNNFENMEIEIPIISITADKIGTFEKIYNLFKAEEYTVEGFSLFISANENIVPLSLYTENKIDDGLIFILDRIYKADIMLFEVDRSIKVDWGCADVQIEYSENEYILKFADEDKKSKTIEELFISLKEYFS